MASTASAVAPLLNLTIRSWQNLGGTPGAPLISFAYDAGPTLMSIGGCVGSGASTAQCVPATTVLTFTGSGFRWYTNPGSVEVWLNAQQTEASGGGNAGTPILTVFNDSYLTLNLAATYTYLLLPIHYGGLLVPIFFNEKTYDWTQRIYTNSYTNQLLVSFIPQPPPNVTSITVTNGGSGGAFGGGGCVGPVGRGPWVNCIPQVSYLTLQGQYMYDIIVTVGGVPCATLLTVSATTAQCLLPYVGGVGPYDVVVSDPTAATVAYATQMGLISYTPNATISSMTSCTDKGLVVRANNWDSSGNCWEGTTITVTGANFPMDSSVQVVATNFPGFNQPRISVYCASPQVMNSQSITCTLPYLSTLTGPSVNASQVFYGATVFLTVSFANGTTGTNSLLLILYINPYAPVVSSIAGCPTSDSALSLSNCNSGTQLTITGRNFLPTLPYAFIYIEPVTGRLGLPPWTCTMLSNTGSQITCLLPNFDPQVSPVSQFTSYPLTVGVSSLNSSSYVTSNAFRVSFGGNAAPAPSSGSSGLSTGAIVAIAVVVPMVTLLIFIAMLWLKRGKQGLNWMSGRTEGFGKQVDVEIK